MLYRPSLWILLLMALGWSVYQIKYEVQQQETALARLNRDIARSESEIRILRAEWSHLNEPARLEQQNAAILGLVPITPQQILTLRTGEGNRQLAQAQLAKIQSDNATVTQNVSAPPELDRGSLAQMFQNEANMAVKQNAGQNKGGLK
ncbi:MAG: hypothetical protein ORN98_08315 [Alphaproteobacteria bacterium]|nr:hypothetical protein [Alphaproteobacteria bacterium]